MALPHETPELQHSNCLSNKYLIPLDDNKAMILEKASAMDMEDRKGCKCDSKLIMSLDEEEARAGVHPRSGT